MPTLQEQQAPIDAEIVNAMIASTPETWNAIRLILERETGKKAVGQFVHELSSPEGHPPVGPDMSLFEATFNLDSLLQSRGGFLRRAEYLAEQKGEQWSYKSKFEYEEGAL
jgi:hypothetical protein